MLILFLQLNIYEYSTVESFFIFDVCYIWISLKTRDLLGNRVLLELNGCTVEWISVFFEGSRVTKVPGFVEGFFCRLLRKTTSPLQRFEVER